MNKNPTKLKVIKDYIEPELLKMQTDNADLPLSDHTMIIRQIKQICGANPQSEFYNWISEAAKPTQMRPYNQGGPELIQMIEEFRNYHEPECGDCYSTAAKLTIKFPQIKFCAGYVNDGLSTHAFNSYNGFYFDLTSEIAWLKTNYAHLTKEEFKAYATVNFKWLKVVEMDAKILNSLLCQNEWTTAPLIRDYWIYVVQKNPIIKNGNIFRL